MKKSALALGFVAFALSLNAQQQTTAPPSDFSLTTEGRIRTTDNEIIGWYKDPRGPVLRLDWRTMIGQNRLGISPEYLGYDSQGNHYLKRDPGPWGTGYFKLTRKAPSLYVATPIENAPPGLTLPGAPPPEPPAEPPAIKGPVKKSPISKTVADGETHIFLTLPDTGEKVEVAQHTMENKMLNATIYTAADKSRIFAVFNATGQVSVYPYPKQGDPK